jgi:hypothetical protein
MNGNLIKEQQLQFGEEYKWFKLNHIQELQFGEEYKWLKLNHIQEITLNPTM